MSTNEVIAARRQHIQDTAPCGDCGATLADCKANRGKDPTAPEWFGCCTRGLAMEPCRHEVDARALLALVREVESGAVRTVEEVTAARSRERVGKTGMSWCDYVDQGQVWQPNGKPAVVIADMDPEWRHNAARWLERNAIAVGQQYSVASHRWFTVATSSPLGPSDNTADSIEAEIQREDAEIDRDPVAWIRTTPLHRALVAGLPAKPKKLAALAERARHWSTCPARTGAGECRCQQIRAEREAATDTTPEWTI